MRAETVKTIGRQACLACCVLLVLLQVDYYEDQAKHPVRANLHALPYTEQPEASRQPE